MAMAFGTSHGQIVAISSSLALKTIRLNAGKARNIEKKKGYPLTRFF